MFGRNNSPAGPVWICYVCAFNGQHVIEGRQLFTMQLSSEPFEAVGETATASIFGSFGSFVSGRHAWIINEASLIIGEHEYLINDCTKEFLKITDKKERTGYLFIAQQSRSYSPF